MSRVQGGIHPLALRASQAAAMLGVSESQLRQWVNDKKIHKPYRVHKNVVLFDAATLASDWDRMKDEAEAFPHPVRETEKDGDKEANPWDGILD